MVVKIADNILSPLGATTTENYNAVKAGLSALRLHKSDNSVVAPFFASLLPDTMLTLQGGAAFLPHKVGDSAFLPLNNNNLSKFERMCIQSVASALGAPTSPWASSIDPSSDRVLFIVSTTKGDVQGWTPLGNSASVIARYFGNTQTPVVVSNACISGLCAQIEAMRLIERGDYDTVIVVGADVQSPFIISGFQSLKALSDEACRPFDADRKGLNLGEAAATIIYGRLSKSQKPKANGQWLIKNGAIRNDANHISGPSRTGEGSYLALRSVLKDVDINDIAFVNAHGTATLYNDEMESIAIARAGLQDIPVGSLKGYYGHTMGAAGILETLISMKAVEDGTVLATRGFQHLGVTHPIRVQSENCKTDRKTFIRLISGFGGCNAAAVFSIVES